MKNLKKNTDMLGKNINKEKKVTLFYIYDDGTVEKKIILEQDFYSKTINFLLKL